MGYGKLTHGFLMSRDDPPECEACNAQLTIEHMHCLDHEYLKRRYFLNNQSTSKCFLNDVDSSHAHGGPLYSSIRDINILKIL